MPKAYRIKNWDSLYENNRTRELKKLDWFPMPNKQDGDGYTLIMELENGAAIFGAWVACAQIASRCDPRGTLLRDGKKPHDSCSLSRMSRISKDIIEAMLKAVSNSDVNWLEIIDLQLECDNLARSCENVATGCLEGKGKKEGNIAPNLGVTFYESEIPSSHNTAEFRALWKDWVSLRRAGKKSRNPDTMFRQQLRDMGEWGLASSLEALKTAIRGDYNGIFPPKTLKAKPQIHLRPAPNP